MKQRIWSWSDSDLAFDSESIVVIGFISTGDKNESWKQNQSMVDESNVLKWSWQWLLSNCHASCELQKNAHTVFEGLKFYIVSHKTHKDTSFWQWPGRSCELLYNEKWEEEDPSPAVLTCWWWVTSKLEQSYSYVLRTFRDPTYCSYWDM